MLNGLEQFKEDYPDIYGVVETIAHKQAGNKLRTVEEKLAKMGDVDEKTKEDMYNKIKNQYDTQSDPRYAAARMWIDEIIDPRESRRALVRALEITAHQKNIPELNFGLLQV